MKISKFAVLLMILMLPFSVTLRAEWFDGEVQKVDTNAKTITISEIDPITDTEEKKEILVGDTTLFAGVRSLKEVRKDDNVTIEALYDEATDVWKAISLEVAEAGA